MSSKKSLFVRLFCAALSLLMLVSLVSCRGGEEEADTTAGGDTTVSPTEVPSEAPTEAPTAAPTDAPTEAPTEAATEAETLPGGHSVVGLSFDTFMLNGERLNDPDGVAHIWLDAHVKDRVIEGKNGFVRSLGFRGWIGFDIAIESFGYRIGSAEPVFNPEFTFVGASDIALVRDPANGGAYAERFAISVPVREVTEDCRVTAVARLADGTVVDLAKGETAVWVSYTGDKAVSEPVSASSDALLKILQYNVKNNTGDSMSARSAALKKTLEFFLPDSVGFQEVTPDWMSHLKTDALPSVYAGVGEPREPGGEATPVFYRADKYELLDSGTFWLSDTPEVQSGVSGTNYLRIATWVKLKNKTTGFVYVHVNTHLDNNGNNSSSVGLSIRTKQMKVVLEFIASLGDVPCFLTGDMNQASANSSGTVYDIYKQITGKAAITLKAGGTWTSPLSDARTAAAKTVPADKIATMVKYFNPYSSDYNPKKLPIDYLFFTGATLEPLLYRTDISVDDNTVISDHLSLYAEFRIK